MKKERIWIAGLVAVVMTLILLTGFTQRIVYETGSRNIFVSADMTNLKQQGKNTQEALGILQDAGADVVTLEPLTIKSLNKDGRLELITYSSLFINEDDISRQIREALGDYPMESDNLVAVVRDSSLREFMSLELSYRYTDYTNRFLEDGETMVFAFQSLTYHNDLIVGYDYLDLALVESVGMKAAVFYPSYTFENPIYPKYFNEFVNSNSVSFVILRNNPHDNKQPLSDEMKATLRTMDFTLVLWENENQIGNEHPYLYDDFFSVMKYNTVRGFHMDKLVPHDQSLYRYRYYQWFNSAIERNTTFIHTNLLENPDVDLETNFNLTAKAISDFTSSMRGYEVTSSREKMPYPYSQNTMVMAGGILALTFLYLYLLFFLRKTPAYFTESYFGLMIVSVIASYAFSEYLAAFYALAIMLFACFLLTVLMFYLDKHMNGKKKLFSILGATFGILLCAIISIAALLGGIEFYTSTAFFYGVKISLLLPILVTICNAYMIYHRDNISLKELPKAMWSWMKQINKWILIPIGVVILLGLVYYLIRSGKSNLILPMEDSFRKWLTDVFYIRPRFKEFLFGYPAFALFLYFGVTNVKTEWKILCGIFATVLFTSLLNTFCHTFTAVTVSLLRVVNGLLCGILVSAVLIGIVILIRHVILPKLQKKTK